MGRNMAPFLAHRLLKRVAEDTFHYAAEKDRFDLPNFLIPPGGIAVLFTQLNSTFYADLVG